MTNAAPVTCVTSVTFVTSAADRGQGRSYIELHAINALNPELPTPADRNLPLRASRGVLRTNW